MAYGPGSKFGAKPVEGTNQFHVACQNLGVHPEKGRKLIPLDFQMNSENIETTAKQIPTFAFMGQFASSNCCLDEPFDGFLTCILQPDMEIKSIES